MGKRLFVLAMLLVWPEALFAQGIPVVPYAANFAQIRLHNELFVQPGVNAEIRRRNRAGTAQPTPVAPPVSTLTYRVDPAQRAQNLSRIVENLRGIDPAGAASLAKLFKSTDIMSSIGQELAKNGFNVNNVADAYAVYWVSAYEASRGITGGDISATRARAVREQAARALAATPAFARSTNAMRQEFAETLLIQSLLIQSSMTALESDKPRQRQLSDAVRQGATEMGLALETMTLTDAGFIAVR